LPFSHLCLRLLLQQIEVAQLYRNRWTIEEFFQSVTLNFEAKFKPQRIRAALFLLRGIGHANILAVIRAALAGVHGWAKLRLSDFYVVDEIQHTYRGMIAIETCPLVCFFSHSR